MDVGRCKGYGPPEPRQAKLEPQPNLEAGRRMRYLFHYEHERSFQEIAFCLLPEFIDFDPGCGIFPLILNVGEYAKMHERNCVGWGIKRR